MKSFLGRLPFAFLAVLFGLSSLALAFSPLLTPSAKAAVTSFPNCNTSGVISKKPPLSAKMLSTYIANNYSQHMIKSLNTDRNDLSATFGMTYVNGDTSTSKMFAYWNGNQNGDLINSVIQFAGWKPGYNPNLNGSIITQSAGAMYAVFNDDGSVISSSGSGSPDPEAVVCISENFNVQYLTACLGVVDCYNGSQDYELPTIEGKYPTFDYSINNTKLTINYTGPPCIQDPNNENSCPLFKLLYTGLKSDKPNESLGVKSLDPSQEYTYDVAGNGSYTWAVGYVSLNQPPMANLPESFMYYETIIFFTVDGGIYNGNTDNCQVDGYTYSCIGNTVFCEDIPNFFENLTCKMKNQFNVGVINPSINAVKSLFTSFVVPPAPACNIPLTNVQILPGYVFPLSTYSQKACASTTQLRTAFPIASIVVNFVLSMAVLFMIVRMINRLLDHNKTDIVEGI